MGTGLQEPVLTCLPLVMVLPTQKPMKLFLGGFESRMLSSKRWNDLRADEGVCLTSGLSLTIDVLDDGRIQR